MSAHMTSAAAGTTAAVTCTGALDDRDAYTIRGRCSIERALDLVGTRSALLLLREAFLGARRFEDLVRRAGLTDTVAAKRLKQLVSDDLLTQQPYQEPGCRTRYEYVLTGRGRAVFPVIVALSRWGDQLDSIPEPVDLAHAGCGEPAGPVLSCAAGHDVPLQQTQA